MSGRLVFFGTPALCLPFLEALHREFELVAAVTQPDTVGGRHRRPIVPAVKEFALAHALPVEQPERLKDPAWVAAFSGYRADLAVVIAYGKLIPPTVFSRPLHRTVNVHFSLLPRYRGAAPVQRALENGEESSGLTVFEIESTMDTGSIWAQATVPIRPDDTTAVLMARMAEVGAPFLVQTIHGILSGGLTRRPQNHAEATVAPMLRKEEGRIRWEDPATRLYNKWRAFTPWPGLHFLLNGRRINVTALRVLDERRQAAPGTVVAHDRCGLRVVCGDQTMVEISEIQPECKKPMPPHAFCLGNCLPPVLT